MHMENPCEMPHSTVSNSVLSLSAGSVGALSLKYSTIECIYIDGTNGCGAPRARTVRRATILMQDTVWNSNQHRSWVLRADGDITLLIPTTRRDTSLSMLF